MVPRADPVTGEPITLMWVKGSGGDLGTLERTACGPVLERITALKGVYEGEEHEDDMVACSTTSLRDGGAAPSIDTLHAFILQAHVDHASRRGDRDRCFA